VPRLNCRGARSRIKRARTRRQIREKTRAAGINVAVYLRLNEPPPRRAPTQVPSDPNRESQPDRPTNRGGVDFLTRIYCRESRTPPFLRCLPRRTPGFHGDFKSVARDDATPRLSSPARLKTLLAGLCQRTGTPIKGCSSLFSCADGSFLRTAALMILTLTFQVSACLPAPLAAPIFHDFPAPPTICPATLGAAAADIRPNILPSNSWRLRLYMLDTSRNACRPLRKT
jgi:hypothetical protein